MTHYPYVEFSGGMQQYSTPHIQKANEVDSAFNARFDKVLGAFVRRPGSQKYDSVAYPLIPQSPIDKPALGAFVARYSTGPELWMASNITADASANVRRWDPIGVGWVNVQTGLPANAEVNFTYDLDEVWCSNYVKSTDTIGTPFTVDNTHSVSTTRHLQFAPFARFYQEYGGTMWAANCTVGGVRYRDRLYKSSGPTGVVAYSRSAQTDVAASVVLVDQVPSMTSNSTPVGVVATSSQFDATRQGYMTFDDVLENPASSRWITVNGTNTGWISYDFGSGQTRIITYYSMVGGGPSEDMTRVPKTWTFEGSNNNSTWTTIDTQTNAPAWAAGEKRTYTVSNTTAYRYYRINVSANQGSASLLAIEQLEFLVSTSGVKAITLNLDAARYVKAGGTYDVYTAGTNTKLFSITVLAVDKINDAITFLPYQLNFAATDVTTATDLITLSDATQFPTGTAIRFTTASSLPAPLVAGTTYYAINISSTTIKVATSLANAQLGVQIDITSQGTGPHTILISYAIGNRDELWGSGRKGLLTRYWNTDYRNPEDSDYLKLPATLDATNDITALGKIASRFFIWTENAMFKYDGQNLTPLYNDVGCISNDTVCYYQDFMAWLDAKGQVWTRNENTGAQDVISTAIQKTIALIPQSALPGATAVCVGKILKITLGQLTIGGSTQSLRILYDFEANTWTSELFAPQMPVQLEYKYLGNIQPHFFDEHGNFWVDELGNDDAGVPIPMSVSVGDDTMQIVGPRSISPIEVDEIKSFYGIKVYGVNAVGTQIFGSFDRGDPIPLGVMAKSIESIAFPKDLPRATVINLSFKNSSSGDPVEIHKVITYFQIEEDTFRPGDR